MNPYEAYIKKEISANEYWEIIKKTKSWRTKEWKEKAEQFKIDKYCVVCGVKENLVIQHTWHPSYKRCKNMIKNRFSNYDSFLKYSKTKKYEKELIELNHLEHKRYMSFQDTKILCKKHAFLEDKNFIKPKPPKNTIEIIPGISNIFLN